MMNSTEKLTKLRGGITLKQTIYAEGATKIDQKTTKAAAMKESGPHFYSSKEALAALRENQQKMESFIMSTRKDQMQKIKEEIREVA